MTNFDEVVYKKKKRSLAFCLVCLFDYLFILFFLNF
jgi:hypothetical protein